jgi:hypothetical protein
LRFEPKARLRFEPKARCGDYSPRMRVLLPLTATAAALLACSLAACGQAERRPVVVATFPAAGQVLPAGLRVVKVTYDVPVSILNPNDARLVTPFGLVPTSAVQLAGDPHSVYVVPLPGVNFPSGVPYSLVVAQGLVVDSELNYPRDEVEIVFSSAADSEVLLGSGATDRVVVANPVDLTELSSTPTPAGRDPVGLLGSEHGGQRRVWVQLADGGGTGHALAWFAPGDAAMQEVLLTHTGELTSTRPAIAISTLGDTLYVAYRDEGVGRVRVCAVDVATATETASILLSPAASAVTFPTGLAVDLGGLLLYAACSDASGARLCLVSTQAFAEIDSGGDPGVDGVAVAAGEGPLAVTVGRAAIAPLAPPDSRLVTIDLPIGAVAPALPAVEHPSGPLGRNVALTATNDGLFYVHGLSEAGANMLLQRPAAAPFSVAAITVSDDVAGAPTGALSVRALGAYPSGATFCAVLDSDVVALFTWALTGISQRDLDAVLAGVQCAPLPPNAAGSDVVGFFQGATP